MRLRGGLLWGAVVVAQLPAVGNAAELAPSAGPQVSDRKTLYPAAYFTPFAPSTALDIAQRVPGFSLDLGNNDVRGFAGTAGNVVINGARPSSKAETLSTVLARIPAKQVLRVELGPGDLYGADFNGKPQVLNIVLGGGGGGLSGTITLAAHRRFTGLVVPDGQVSLLWKRGKSSLNLAAGLARGDYIEEGTDRFVTFPAQSLLEFRRKVNTVNDRTPFVSANWALEEAPDRSIRANIRYSPASFKLDQANHVVPSSGPPRDDTLREDYRNPTIELGGDLTRPLGGGALKLVGLATRTKRDNFDGIYVRPGGVVDGGFEQTAKAQRNETLGRLNWTKDKLAGMRVEVGGEAALNTLDSDVTLDVLGPGGARTTIDLPIDHARVRETRAELFANAGRNLTPKLRAEVGIAYETSRLLVTGDASARRNLSFFKPSLSLDWQAPGAWHVQASLRRTVAQLDFYDFISTAELTSDRVNGGNADLVPQRAWEARLTIEHPLLDDGLAKLESGYDRIDLLQDRVLTSDGFDAPGNLGRATRSFASITLDLPLGSLGIKGGRLKANGQVQSTRVVDPVSATRRAFSGFWPKWQWSLDYRQDLGRFAYGANLAHRARFAFYRIDEIDSNKNGGPYLTAFVEYRPSKRTTFTLDVDNALSTRSTRTRLFSFPSRAVATTFAEYRERNAHRTFTLTVKRSFG